MGEVYRARDLHLDRDVALKVLTAGFPADQAARKRFRREALALSKINHPNIATVFDFDTQDDAEFLVMELIHGTPLSVLLSNGPVQEGEIVRLGTQLAEGLAAAHAHGVIHRDLKPGNLMITPEGRLKILDFGLAILAQGGGELEVTRSVTEIAFVAGTPPYMSPEQLRGQIVDARSDVYAAGAVLYEMMTGRRPFPQSQSAELIGAILHQLPPPPSTLVHGATTALQSLVMRALAKEPDQRYQSARELLVALESAALTVGTAATQPARRRAVDVARAMALVAVLLIGLTMGLNVRGLRDRVFGGGASRKEAVSAAGTPIRVRRSVAVLGFKNLSGRPNDAWLSTALSEMLMTELAAGEHLHMIPGENVSQTKISLSLADADSYGQQTLARIRENLGTDDIVLGSYLVLEGGADPPRSSTAGYRRRRDLGGYLRKGERGTR